MSKPIINIYWFKRDLRIFDNVPLQLSCDDEHPTLLVFLFEPELVNNLHYSERHWNFVQESILDINKNLKKYQTKIHCFDLNAIQFFKKISNRYKINKIFSHQETGIKITYKRDKDVSIYCKENGIKWHEEIRNGVFRGRSNRDNWIKDWNDYMKRKIINLKCNNTSFFNINDDLIKLKKN